MSWSYRKLLKLIHQNFKSRQQSSCTYCLLLSNIERYLCNPSSFLIPNVNVLNSSSKLLKGKCIASDCLFYRTPCRTCSTRTCPCSWRSSRWRRTDSSGRGSSPSVAAFLSSRAPSGASSSPLWTSSPSLSSRLWSVRICTRLKQNFLDQTT